MSNHQLDQYKHQLSYTTCNEDSNSEIKALDIRNSDTVLCITGSGGRTLNLLTAQPHAIISVDFNPIQNWMLELKMAAIKNLDYDGYCKFLGLRECHSRLTTLDKLSGDLSEAAREFWLGKKTLIKKGIIYQGKFERHYRLSSNFIKLFRRNKVKKIFSLTDLNEQKKYYATKWDNRFWKFLVALDSSKSNYQRTINDPAYYLYVDNSFDYQHFFYERLAKAFTTGLANENHFLALTIDGSYQRVKKLPLYLQEENFQTLKANIHRINIVTGSLEDYLSKTWDNSIDKFSISDVSGYLDDGQYEALFGQIIRAAKNNGIFCSRNFIVKKGVPAKYQAYVNQNTALERILEDQDLAFVYSFVIGQINK